MIGLAYYNAIPTTLDLNGPILSITQQPEAQTVNDGGSVEIIGIATATFPQEERATNTGTLSYQWYEVGVGALSNSNTISGAGSTTLSITNLSNPADTGRQFYLRSEYVPSAYQTSSPVTAGTARSTGYAINGPLDSEIVGVTVNPTITINTQPSDETVAQTQDATFTVDASASDGSDLTYQWNVNGTPVSDSGTVSGATTPTLTVSTGDVSVNDVSVTVSHPTAGNSPVTSDTATWTTVSARSIVSYDYLDDTANYYGRTTTNLFDGPLTITADPGAATRSYSLWAPEKNVKVRITMAAGAGASRNGNRGGYGGLSVFELELIKNTEYVLKLGAATMPTGGTNGGGGAAYLYKKAQLLVALGGGGGAGTQGRGGDGGGVSIAGERGAGRNGGAGGALFAIGTLPVTGFFPGGQVYGGVNWSSPTAGRASGCPMGGDWFRARYSPCADMGVQKWRVSNGSELSQTASILRGYKPGIGHRNNGGNGSGDNGGGASGAQGGNAGGGSGSGGGGGSGYSNGEVTLISTQLGGNTSTNAFITLEYVA